MTGGEDLAVAAHHHAVGDAKGVVRVMRREKNGRARGLEARHLVEDQRLVAEVEVRGGLVHEEVPRLAGERACDEGELALAAAHAVDRPLGERGDAKPREARQGELAIAFAGHGEDSAMGRASHLHHLEDAEVEVALRGLRDVGEARRALASRPRLEAASVECHVARKRCDEPQECAKQRRLAAAVGSEQAHDLARGKFEIHAVADTMAAESEIEGARGERHEARLKATARRAMNTGVPTNAVTTPGGISVANIVRHAVSTASMNPAPRTSESGSRRAKAAPVRSRAAWGTRSPIQPMVPASDTADAVASVAATMIAVRRCFTFTPRLRASSSESASTSMRQRNSHSTATESAIGTIVAGRSRGSAPVKLPSSQKVIAGSWLYGSATYFTSAMPAPKSDPTTTPVRTSVRTGSRPPIQVPIATTSPTAISPPTNANAWIAPIGSDASTAIPAPRADTPRMSGDTRGLRKRFWYAAPAAARAAPTASAATTRGARTWSTIASTLRASPLSSPKSEAHSTRTTSPAATAKRPTVKLQATSNTSSAIATRIPAGNRERGRIIAAPRRARTAACPPAPPWVPAGRRGGRTA